jgi:hypothetical protein
MNIFPLHSHNSNPTIETNSSIFLSISDPFSPLSNPPSLLSRMQSRTPRSIDPKGNRFIQDFSSLLRTGNSSIDFSGRPPDLSLCNQSLLSEFSDLICEVFLHCSASNRFQILALLRAQETQQFLKILVAKNFFKIAFIVWVQKGGVFLVSCLCDILVEFYSAVSLVYSEPWMLEEFLKCVQSKSRRRFREEKKGAARAIALCARAEMPVGLRERVLEMTRRILDSTGIEFWEDIIDVPRFLITSRWWARHILIDLGFLGDYEGFLCSENVRFVEVALWTFGQHYLYCEEALDIDLGVVVGAARSEVDSVRSAAFWLAGNMIAGAPGVIRRFADLGFFDVVGKVFDEGMANARVEAFYVLESVVRGGSDDEILSVVENCCCIEVFVGISEIEDPKLTQRALSALTRIFRMVDATARGVCFTRFLDSHGLEVIRNLADDAASVEVARLAQKMLELLPDLRQ